MTDQTRGSLLLIDPDDAVREGLRIYFENQGFVVRVCKTAHDAYDLIDQQLPTLIITEVELRGETNGIEMMRYLLDQIRTGFLPIIFLTYAASREQKIKAFRLGADDYITKPFDIEELELRVDRTIRRM